MPLKQSFIALLAVLLLLRVPSLTAQEVRPVEDIAGLVQQSSQAYAESRYLDFYLSNMKLHQLRPFEPEYMYNIVRACALLERDTNALHFMLEMQKQGLSYDFNATEDTLSIRNSEAYRYLNDLMIEAGKPNGEGTVAFNLPGAPSDFGALAWDESRQTLLAGTVNEGKLFALGPNGEHRLLLEAKDVDGMWSIFGLAVDAGNQRLWVSSHATPRFMGFSPAVKGGGALLEFDLDSLALLARYELPDASFQQMLGSLSVTDDGHVYVIDQRKPIVYQKTPGASELRAFVASNELVRFTDTTASPDNGRIFAADEIMGVFVIDPLAQQTTMLAGPEILNLGGLTAIEFRNGNLFIIQGGISPQRIMRLQLDASGARVEETAPMAIALEPFDRPGVSTVSNDTLYYLANPESKDAAMGGIVMQTPLTAGNNIAPPDKRLFEEQLRKGQQQ